VGGARIGFHVGQVIIAMAGFVVEWETRRALAVPAQGGAAEGAAIGRMGEREREAVAGGAPTIGTQGRAIEGAHTGWIGAGIWRGEGIDAAAFTALAVEETTAADVAGSHDSGSRSPRYCSAFVALKSVAGLRYGAILGSARQARTFRAMMPRRFWGVIPDRRRASMRARLV